jgi:hypothetical protein
MIRVTGPLPPPLLGSHPSELPNAPSDGLPPAMPADMKQSPDWAPTGNHPPAKSGALNV